MMDTMQTTTTTTNKNTPLIGIGARLKTARESLQMSEKDAASRLHLSVKFINQMENEEFQGDTPITFLRGYLRSYGRILNIPEKEINDAIQQLGIHSPTLKLFTPLLNTPVSSNNERYVKWITYLITAVLIALVAMWWSSHTKENDAKNNLQQPDADAIATPTAENSTPAPETNPPAAANAVVATPAAATMTPDQAHPVAMPAPSSNNATETHPLKPQTNNVGTPVAHPQPNAPEGTVSNQKPQDAILAPAVTPLSNPNAPASNPNAPAATPTDANAATAANADDTSDEEDAPPPKKVRKSQPTHTRMAVPEPGLDTSDF